jgi:pilus assembly protein Flp/PilA
MLTSFEYLTGWMRAKFGQDERGASLVEYALLLALIAVVCIIAVTTLGNEASEKFDSVADEIGS